MSTVTQRIQELQTILDQHRSGGQNVRLVAVSKYATLDQICEAYEAGIRDFGENKVQDFEAKLSALPPTVAQNSRWHFLGHVQRNKIKKIRTHQIHLIHSMDSLTLALMLSEANEKYGSRQPVLLQVNLTQEPQKTGFSRESLLEEFPKLMNLSGIEIQGLMTMGPHTMDAAASIHVFTHLANIRDHLEQTYSIRLPELSMGMSQDFVHALKCGATIIRIGNRIFGA